MDFDELARQTVYVDDFLAASRARRWLDRRIGAQRGHVDAEDIRRLCVDAADDGDPFGIRIANAHVEGVLDLRAVHVGFPLHFAGCVFEEPPRLDGADLHELAITGGSYGGEQSEGSSHLPGLLANGVRIRRDLVLSGTEIVGGHVTTASLTRTSAVWLTEADIGGRLLAFGTTIRPGGGRAIQADRTRIAGDVRLAAGFVAEGEIRLLATRLGGSLDLSGSSLLPGDGRALDLAEAVIGGSLFILDDPGQRQRPRIRGRIEAGRTEIRGRFLIRNADLEAPPRGTGQHVYGSQDVGGRPCLLAPRLSVHGECLIEGETLVKGGLLLHGAELRGGLRASGAMIWNAGDVALDLSGADIGAALDLSATLIEGTVRLGNARIAGELDLHGAHLTHPHRQYCLVAATAHIAGGVSLRDTAARGGSVNLRGAVIAGIVDAEGAQLTNPGHVTLGLSEAQIAGNVRLCKGFSSTGLVSLNRATIAGRLRCDAGTFRWEPQDATPAINVRGCAFEAISAKVHSGIGLEWRIVTGAVDFTDAQTSYLADDPDHDWPARCYLGGFVYQRFAPVGMRDGHGEWSITARRRWLDRIQPYDPRPWEQAAHVLRLNGQQRGAEDLLIAQRRRARRHRRESGEPAWRLLFDRLQDTTVGYGFRPERALLFLLAMVAMVALTLTPPQSRAAFRATDQAGAVYTPSGRQNQPTGTSPAGPCGGGTVRCFNPIFYALDTVVPILDLHQRDTWYLTPSNRGTAMEWWLNSCTILGWLFSTTFALAFTRLGRSTTGG